MVSAMQKRLRMDTKTPALQSAESCNPGKRKIRRRSRAAQVWRPGLALRDGRAGVWATRSDA
jgi:hypothetical protein